MIQNKHELRSAARALRKRLAETDPLAASRAAVDAFHAAALAHGGSDAGAPGLRPHYGPGFYAGYVRDPDGNKLNAVCYDREAR